VQYCAICPGELRRGVAARAKFRVACAAACARLIFFASIFFWADKTPDLRNKQAACTWARSSAVIKIERSEKGACRIYNCLCAPLFFCFGYGGVAKAPWRPDQRELEAKRKTRGINRARFAGAACTWARSSAVIKTERSEQETRPSGASKSSERSRLSRKLLSLHQEDLQTKSRGATWAYSLCFIYFSCCVSPT
jgi:hypothetical protein